MTGKMQMGNQVGPHKVSHRYKGGRSRCLIALSGVEDGRTSA